jgi:sarcosine oxidase, subunit beta
MSESYDAIVIGAGVIGNAVAFELSKQGRRTLSLDRLPASGYGSTGSSCAIIRTHYSTEDGAALAYEGWFYWKHWRDYLEVDDERGLSAYHDIGCAVLKTEKNGHLKSILANMDKLGIPYEEWDDAAMRRRMPIWDTRSFAPVRTLDDPEFGKSAAGAVGGAAFFPKAGYVADPQLSAHNLQVAAEAKGATFRFNAQVVEILRRGGRVAGVRLADGSEIAAPVVVNVAGPHSYKVNAMAGVLDGMNITTRALRQEVAHVPSPEGFDFERDGFVVSDSDIGCYSRPEVGNHILVGSEDPECDVREWVDPDEYNRDFTEQWTAQVHRQAQRIPTLPIPSRPRGVVDLYDVSDDWIPIYDKSDLPGFYMAIGTSGNQFKNAPVAGAMMAALVDYCEAGADHDAEPLRFTLKHSGRTINVGFYSRRREINKESSFSVLG